MNFPIYYDQLNKDLMTNFGFAYESTQGIGTLPHASGVYFVIDINQNRERECVYIGSSKNLFNRVYGKHKIHDYSYKRKGEGCCITFVWYETNDYIELEKKLIRYFRPKLNKLIL